MNHIKNLAIVDDDETFVYLTKMTIEETKLVDIIEVFRNGLDALNFLKENFNHIELLPEVILLDISMPVMDGWLFLEEYIKLKPRIGKKITIYIVSSSISPKDILKAKSINDVTDYIIKPITKENLIDLIKKI
jgi:CheY-like chemotaxis protein